MKKILLLITVGLYAQEVMPYNPRIMVRDVNYDGIINCIDYAVVFYENYPNSKIVRVEYGMFNHVLNYYGGRYVEPQAVDGDPVEMWGFQFTYPHKENVTEYYKRYATERKW
jgi:hypothetical protein